MFITQENERLQSAHTFKAESQIDGQRCTRFDVGLDHINPAK